MTSPHFAWLPPEINSALMFAGPGAGPLLAAAAAWDGLAEDLATSATAFGSVTSELAGNSWLGPSSAAMMAVATQYVGLLSTSAAQAEQAAGQARATATAFETALAATVQPAVVAGNRALQQVLAATNWLGQNAPAIADIEAAYEQMWALDVAAMTAYHVDASEAATQLAPWKGLLQDFGININSNGQVSLGFGNTGGGNVGAGNTGSGNAGSGNQGSDNLGIGNIGIGNIGFGNTGNGDIGFGLTGNHQIGFGGFNAGSGNIGFGNTGTGNIGFFNSGSGNIGIGNTGTSNTGFFNTGSVNTGFANTGTSNLGFLNTGTSNLGFGNTGLEQTGILGQATPDASLLNAARATTGGINTASASSNLLGSAIPDIGGVGANLQYANLLGGSAVPAAAAGAPVSFATGGLDAASSSLGVSMESATGSVTGGAVRSAAYGFVSAANNDAGARNSTSLREPGGRVPASAGSGIPKSGFFPDREPEEPETVLRLPLHAD